MSKKLVFFVFAILIAVGTLLFCIGFSQAYTVTAAQSYKFSLEGLSLETKGNATVSYGDDRLNIIKAPVKEGAAVLLYFISVDNFHELIADSDGKFIAGVDGYTDDEGRFTPDKPVPSELYPVWFTLTQTDNYMQLSFFDPYDAYIGEYINFTFQWYDADGLVPGQTSNDIQRADCYCEVTVRTAKVSYTVTLPETDLTSYTINYELNGGDFVPGYTPQYSYFDEQVILPACSDISRAGYRFDGWYDNPDLIGGQITEISETETGNKKYYAKWTPETYAVTLITNGGSAAFDVTQYTYEVGAELPTATMTGHDFLGWYADSRFEGDAVVCIRTYDTGDIVLYAKWKASEYTVGYQTDGGSLEEGAPSYYTYGLGAQLPSVTKYGYYFDGWYDNPDFTGMQVTNISETETGDKIYYAKWVLVGYSIEYQTNGGEIIGGYTASYTLGQAVTLPGNVTRTGYVFCGWYLAENFCGNSITTYYAPSGGNLIFYAKWEAEIYSITVSEGAGYKLSASKEFVEYGGSFDITFEPLDGFMGGTVYINGVIWSGGTYEGVTSDIYLTVDGIRLNEELFFLAAQDGTYTGGEHAVNAFNDIGLSVKFSWYLNGEISGEPVKVATGTQSGLALVDAGTYNIVLVISAIGAENITVVKTAVVVISKAVLSRPSASFDGGVITLSPPDGTGGGVAGYLCLNGYDMDGNKLTVTEAGTYTFVAVGDKNHYDSEQCSITVHSVTFVSEESTVAVLYAAYGHSIDITFTAERKNTADYYYIFSGWYDGDSLFDGYVYDNLVLTARFAEYTKKVTGGGVTITSEDGMASDAFIELSEDVDGDVKEAFISGAAVGVAVHFVDISLVGAPEGSYTVTYRLPSGQWGKSLAVYHYLPDGTVERLQSYIAGGDIVFITDGFSPFAFFDVTEYTLYGYDGDGNTYFMGSYINGDYITLSAVAHPVSEGYVYLFDGWFLDEGMQTQVGGVTISGDTVLYARFIKKEISSVVYYNVTAIDKNGNMYYIGTYAKGATADLSGYKVTPSGAYVYDGLYNSADEKITQIVVSGDICLYVKFIYTDDGSTEPDIEPVYRSLSGVSGDTVFNLFMYEDGTVLSLMLFSLPAYEEDGKTYIFEGWYSDAGLTHKISSVIMDGDKTVYAKFIVRQAEDDGIWLAISVSAASAALLLIVLIIAISVRIKPKRIPVVAAVAQTAADPLLMRAEENFRYVSGELDNAENYLKANPDREKNRSLSNARGLLKECEYILKGMRENANTASGGKENHFAEASLDRLFYEINSIISGEIF